MSFKKNLLELLNTIFQLTAFIGAFYLITGSIKQSIGLGYIFALFWWQLNDYKNLKNKVHEHV